MRGWLARQLSAYSMPGMHDPVEGVWYVHARSVLATVTPPEGRLAELKFGLDITPPRAIPRADIQFTDGHGSVVPFTRRDLLWKSGQGKTYDDLSGDSRFAVYLNGTKKRTAWIVTSWPHMGVSIEDLPAGKNIIGVAAVDAAGNEGPITSLTSYVDTDTPTISIVSPAPGQVVRSRVAASVDATDTGGISGVRYEVDGTTIGVSTVAPYSMTLDLSDFSDGRHVLKAVVTDLYGRTATAIRSFILDSTPPRLSSVSVSPTDFYPLIKDGYLDHTTVRFRLSERTRVRLEVRDAVGRLIYSTTSVENPGIKSFRWSGQGIVHDDSKPFLVARYRLRVVATDAAGNVGRTRQHTVAVRTYQIRRVASDKARVIQR